MKKIFLLITLSVFAWSCSDDITNQNIDVKNPTTTKAEFLFTNAQKALVDQVVNTSVNTNVFRLFSQQWTETTYLDESRYNVFTRTIPDNHFAILYRDVIRDLLEAKGLLNAENPLTPTDVAVLKNKKALVDLHIAYAFSLLVDTFGNVPYSQALNIENFPNPAYDDAKTIYKDLISKINTDIASFTSGQSSFGSADLIYAGNVDKWKKFANSLVLRMALNMDDVDHAYASTQVLNAVASGLISSNAENANLAYLSAQPNTNPLYVDLVASGRFDFVPANTLVDKMNTLNDPRRAKYFTYKSGTTSYIGGTYGFSSPYANYSHINATLLSATFPGTIFDYSEVEFLLAEAVARGIAVGGTVTTHYNAGITASMQNWGVAASDITTYLAQPTVDYATATGNWKQKIGEQAWLALYNRGFEAWTSFRRLDFPALLAPTNAYNSLPKVPTRFTYPAKEQTLNSASVSAAATAIGGDNLTTKIFWDVN
ncbi:hypothetical protein B0A58_03030 [Flavobacterium branchiophilum NBRC 15030 = ATCC 35035]|uniref:SusD-like starch-binding protein associating with outer membrane n=1 Tax=Flavobacterium branchiophilum TaxID=55197 RepID=A0A543G1I2_9FLAO|nr:SusD/RagB family nutrient-binding outer membrane lipoprotein [Flavobacterium branchiophilum]OXA79775.1 hypothetical protein B0A58_03030 [Flavobacterium branchiophilum NBRC 15030 = ATCC 35035]TQM39931.1 SusD-like starch-binding protein associating with outer membrane [Flavobacterium branchiophilum]GEM56132.1 hypothetical protein FB1_23530 [Flavobacterium branchiophilum NBRC 15030 = ATCC 35035]